MIIPIGHKNYIESDSIVAILRPDSAPAKILRHSANESGKLINATSGRKARSVIVLKTNHVVLSALQPETLEKKFMKFVFNKAV
jgi:regulator of extracellular matrix RemA (YlzA/DUF370 family)